MHLMRAFWDGVLAGAVMVIITSLARVIGADINIGMLLGTMFGLAPGVGTWLLGFAIHLVLSGIIAWAYAGGFESVTHRASGGIGAAFSVIHIIVAGLVMGVIPYVHAGIPETIAPPGFFAANLGPAAILTFVLAHLVYGILVGALYGPVKRHAAVTERGGAAPAPSA